MVDDFYAHDFDHSNSLGLNKFLVTELEDTQIKNEPTPSLVPDYQVKSWPWFFEQMVSLQKKHDMRDLRDREYKVGDVMLLREFDPRIGKYTGRTAQALITYITSNTTPCAMSSSALDNNYAILSIEIIEADLETTA